MKTLSLEELVLISGGNGEGEGDEELAVNLARNDDDEPTVDVDAVLPEFAFAVKSFGCCR